MFIRQVTRIAIFTAALALATAPAFAGGSSGGTGTCWGNCGTTPPPSGGGGGSPVPEPSTLALLGLAIPGTAAWIKRKLG